MTPNSGLYEGKEKNRTKCSRRPSEEASFGFSSLFDSLFNCWVSHEFQFLKLPLPNFFLNFFSLQLLQSQTHPTNSQQLLTVSWICWFGLRWALKILNGVGPGQVKPLCPWLQRGAKRMTLHRPWLRVFSESTLLFPPSFVLLILLGLPRTRLSSVKSCEFIFFIFFIFCRERKI